MVKSPSKKQPVNVAYLDTLAKDIASETAQLEKMHSELKVLQNEEQKLEEMNAELATLQKKEQSLKAMEISIQDKEKKQKERYAEMESTLTESVKEKGKKDLKLIKQKTVKNKKKGRFIVS